MQQLAETGPQAEPARPPFAPDGSIAHDTGALPGDLTSTPTFNRIYNDGSTPPGERPKNKPIGFRLDAYEFFPQGETTGTPAQTPPESFAIEGLYLVTSAPTEDDNDRSDQGAHDISPYDPLNRSHGPKIELQSVMETDRDFGHSSIPGSLKVAEALADADDDLIASAPNLSDPELGPYEKVVSDALKIITTPEEQYDAKGNLEDTSTVVAGLLEARSDGKTEGWLFVARSIKAAIAAKIDNISSDYHRGRLLDAKKPSLEAKEKAELVDSEVKKLGKEGFVNKVAAAAIAAARFKVATEGEPNEPTRDHSKVIETVTVNTT